MSEWIKRIKEEDFLKCETIEELTLLLDGYQLQVLKDQQLKDAEFIIVEPKQLTGTTPTSEANTIQNAQE